MQNGFETQRFGMSHLAALNDAEISPRRAECHNASPDAACVYNSSSSEKITVFGDSHAVELAYAIGEAVKPLDISVMHLSSSGCPPALTFLTEVSGCVEWTQASLDHLVTAEPETVILVYRHALYLFGSNAAHDHPYPALPHSPYRIMTGCTAEETRVAYWPSFKELVIRLSGVGHRVILLAPFPEIVRSAQTYILHDSRRAGPDQNTPPDIPSIPRSYHDARTKMVKDNLALIAAMSPDVSLLDASHAFCDSKTCYAVRDGKTVYFDDNHPSISGAGRTARYILDAATSPLSQNGRPNPPE